MRISRAIPLCIALFAPLAVTAQDKPAAQPDASELRARIQTDKRAVVAKNLPLTEAEAKKFWPLYDNFQRELATPRAKINRAILDYVGSESTISDAGVKKLSQQVLDGEATELKLRTAHFSKVQKVLPMKKAARYMQIENKIRAVLDYEAALAIPLVP